MTNRYSCPYKNKCKYYTVSGKCNSEKYLDCQLVEFGLIEDLIKGEL